MLGCDVAGVAERRTATRCCAVQQQHALAFLREAKCAGKTDDAGADHQYVGRADDACCAMDQG